MRAIDQLPHPFSLLNRDGGGVAGELRGRASGVGLSSGALSVVDAVALSGAAVGVGLVIAAGLTTVEVSRLAGSAYGQGYGVAYLSVSDASVAGMAGSATGRGTAAGALAVTDPQASALVGSALGQASASGVLTASNPQPSGLAGSATGLSAVIRSDLSAMFSNALAGSAVGVGSASGVLTNTAPASDFVDDFSGDGNLGDRSGWTFMFGSATATKTSGGSLNNTLSSPESGWCAPDTASVNHFAQGGPLLTVGTNGPLICCAVRDSDNWIGVRNSASNYAVLKKVAGTVTVVATLGQVPAVGDIQRLEQRDRDLSLFVNGVSIWTGNLPAGELAGETKVGVVTRTSTRNPWLDGWRSGKL